MENTDLQHKDMEHEYGITPKKYYVNDRHDAEDLDLDRLSISSSSKD